jgi:hypothetical protein
MPKSPLLLTNTHFQYKTGVNGRKTNRED